MAESATTVPKRLGRGGPDALARDVVAVPTLLLFERQGAHDTIAEREQSGGKVAERAGKAVRGRRR
jgi:hypothetical protein